MMALKLTKYLPLWIAVWGCVSTQTPWIVDTLPGDPDSFGSSRLRYLSAEAHCPLTFELLKIGDQVEAFVSSVRFRFRGSLAKVILTIDGQSFEDEIPIHEGRMRLRLPPRATQRVIEALQGGKKIGIVVDDFEETLDPAHFSSLFASFIGGGQFFESLFKGPVE